MTIKAEAEHLFHTLTGLLAGTFHREGASANVQALRDQNAAGWRMGLTQEISMFSDTQNSKGVSEAAEVPVVVWELTWSLSAGC